MIDNAPIPQKMPNNTKSSGFKFNHVTDVIKNFKPTDWLINGYFQQHSMGIIFGDPAAGKTFVAIDMACCISVGIPYHGHNTKKGAVFYIAGEGQNGLALRFKAWEEGSGVNLEDGSLHVATSPIQLYDLANAEILIATIDEMIAKHNTSPSLIIIDTLARNFGGDENSSKEVSQFISHLDMIKNHWNAAILIVHHNGHSHKDRPRGSLALTGALEHEYRVQKYSETSISLKNTKTKDGPVPNELFFDMRKVPLRFDSNEDIIEGVVLTKSTKKIDKPHLSDKAKRALSVLRHCIDEKGEKRMLKSESTETFCIAEDEYIEALKKDKFCKTDKWDSIKKAGRRYIKVLEKQWIIKVSEGFVWLTDNSDKNGQTKN